jgi:hypothetical protein
MSGKDRVVARKYPEPIQDYSLQRDAWQQAACAPHRATSFSHQVHQIYDVCTSHYAENTLDLSSRISHQGFSIVEIAM